MIEPECAAAVAAADAIRSVAGAAAHRDRHMRVGRDAIRFVEYEIGEGGTAQRRVGRRVPLFAARELNMPRGPFKHASRQ